MGFDIRCCAGLARRELTVAEFARPLNTSLAAVSKHLKLLENAGLVHRTVDQPAERPERANSVTRATKRRPLAGSPFVSNSMVVRLHPPALVLRNLAFAEAAGGERQ